MSNNEHKFTAGDGVKGLTKDQHIEIISAWQRNWGDMVYLQPSDTQEYNAVFHKGKLEIGFVNVTNPIPYNDMICLIKGELPNAWAVKCTTQTRMHSMWPTFLESIGGFVGDCIGEYYSPMLKTPTLQSGDTEILFTTWVAIYELNNQEQTLEEQVNECKEQTEDVAFIAIEDGRTLFKVDNEGFVSIGYTVVGQEPLLPKHFLGVRKMVEHNGQDFNPNEAFEVSVDGVDWINCGSHGYVGVYHGVCINGIQSYWPRIRNVKKPELKLKYGDPAWGKQENCNPEGVWLFGTFAKTKDGSLVINHQDAYPVACSVIRPFFVDGVATYPPFL